VSSRIEFVKSTIAVSVSSTLCRAYSAGLTGSQYTGKPAKLFNQISYSNNMAIETKLNMEDAMDHSRWRGLIKDV